MVRVLDGGPVALPEDEPVTFSAPARAEGAPSVVGYVRVDDETRVIVRDPQSAVVTWMIEGDQLDGWQLVHIGGTTATFSRDLPPRFERVGLP